LARFTLQEYFGRCSLNPSAKFLAKKGFCIYRISGGFRSYACSGEFTERFGHYSFSQIKLLAGSTFMTIARLVYKAKEKCIFS